MIVGVGVDIVEISRIEKALGRQGQRFRARLFTENEIAYCESHRMPAQFYAARFAAKEAALKALGTGWSQGIQWVDIEVTRMTSGQPQLIFHGKALERATQMGVVRSWISLSHCDQHAIAQVILEA